MDLAVETVEPLLDEMTETQQMDGKSVGTISLHRTLCLEGYMLIVLQNKGELKWG